MADSAAPPSIETAGGSRPAGSVTWYDYAKVGALMSALIGVLIAVRGYADDPAPRPEQLLGPMFALIALTAIVWLTMVVVRNMAVMRGLTGPEYFLTYNGAQPLDWIERPARTFNNLMQVPPLFYAVCLLMMVTHHVDRAQLFYAWIYVALRAAHAAIYIGWNPLPYRFAAWVTSCIVLWTIWTRFALQVWPVL
ncbi:MAG: MAPEG family protein [Polyangiales bacterium]